MKILPLITLVLWSWAACGPKVTITIDPLIPAALDSYPLDSAGQVEYVPVDVDAFLATLTPTDRRDFEDGYQETTADPLQFAQLLSEHMIYVKTLKNMTGLSVVRLRTLSAFEERPTFYEYIAVLHALAYFRDYGVPKETPLPASI